jgi:hypothetical protein
MVVDAWSVVKITVICLLRAVTLAVNTAATGSSESRAFCRSKFIMIIALLAIVASTSGSKVTIPLKPPSDAVSDTAAESVEAASRSKLVGDVSVSESARSAVTILSEPTVCITLGLAACTPIEAVAGVVAAAALESIVPTASKSVFTITVGRATVVEWTSVPSSESMVASLRSTTALWSFAAIALELAIVASESAAATVSDTVTSESITIIESIVVLAFESTAAPAAKPVIPAASESTAASEIFSAAIVAISSEPIVATYESMVSIVLKLAVVVSIVVTTSRAAAASVTAYGPIVESLAVFNSIAVIFSE